MKDHETLQTHSIKDNMTVHLVIKSGAATPASNTNTASSTSPAASTGAGNTTSTGGSSTEQSPLGLGGLGGLGGMGLPGLGSANFMEMQQQMTDGMRNNPELMRQLMDSPLTQSLMSNPDIMRGLIQSNPQMRQVI